MALLLKNHKTQHRENRKYAPADQCSPLLSEKASRVADFILRRSNLRRRLGLGDGRFYENYNAIVGLAIRAYPLPLSTTPKFRTDSPRHEIPRR